MCILFVCTLPPPRLPYSLILLSIRDEQFDRPTEAAAWREGILSGEFSIIFSAERGAVLHHEFIGEFFSSTLSNEGTYLVPSFDIFQHVT